VRLTVPVLRDLAMLGLGCGGMVHELFLVVAPDPVRVTVSLLLLGGPAAVNTWWLARNPATTPPAAPGPSPLPAPPPSSSSPP